MRVNSGTLGSLGRAAVFAAAGFIGNTANAQEPILGKNPIAQISENDKSLEEKVRELEKLISEQQKEIVLNRNEIQDLKADKYTRYIPLVVYTLAIIYLISNHARENRKVKRDLDAALEGLAKTTAEQVKITLEELRKQESESNPFANMMNSVSKGANGARLTSAFHHIFSQIDDRFTSAITDGNFGAAAGIDNIEDLHGFLNGQSDLFKDYSTYTDDERNNLPINSFGKKFSTQNHEHDEGDLPGNETQETNLILIPTDFQDNQNLYITLLAREFSRVIYKPNEDYKTLAESQVTAFEKELDIIETLILFLNKLNLNISFDDLKETFPIQIENENFEGFKGFVQSLELNPKILKEITDQHLKELDGWRAIQKKA